jgi:hypothetical protein
MLLFLFGADCTEDDKRQVEASKSQAQGVKVGVAPARELMNL